MSSDLNPIENLWQELKVRINRQSLKNLQELEHVTEEEWKKIVIFWPLTRPKMPFQGDAPEGGDTF